MMDGWKGRGNQYIQLVKVVYCEVATNGKQLTAFPHEVRPGFKFRCLRWEVSVLPLCHHDPKETVYCFTSGNSGMGVETGGGGGGGGSGGGGGGGPSPQP